MRGGIWLGFAVIVASATLASSNSVTFPYQGDGVVPSGFDADSAGNVFFAATTTPDDWPYQDFMVASVTPGGDRVRWVTTIASLGIGRGEKAAGIAIDPHGDALVVGRTDYVEDFGGDRIAVVKLDGASGSPLWRASLGLGYGLAVAVDRHGDALVAASDVEHTRLVKLASGDGAVLWNVLEDLGYGFATTVTVDDRGDAVISAASFVAKYAAADGRLLWRAAIQGVVRQHALAGGGDVVTTEEEFSGTPAEEIRVVVRRAGDGVVRWQSVVERTENAVTSFPYSPPVRLVVDPSGVIVVAANDRSGDPLPTYFGEHGVVVTGLDGVSGRQLWRRAFQGDDGGGQLAALFAGDHGPVVWWREQRIADWNRTTHLLALDPTGAVRWWQRVSESGFGGAGVVAGGPIVIVGADWSEASPLIRVETRSARTGAPLPCGDGHVDPSESCDDGNAIDGDGCDRNCTPSACGNGIVAPDEECDDGNARNDDGCNAKCDRELTCGAVDFRGEWSLTVTCTVAVPPIRLDYTQNITLGQDCRTGRVTMQKADACNVMFSLFPVSSRFTCRSTPSPLDGIASGHALRMPATGQFSSTIETETPVTFAGCTFDSIRTDAFLAGRVAESPPGRAAVVRGALSGTYQLDGACNGLAETPCTFDLVRVSDPPPPQTAPDPPVRPDPYRAAIRAALVPFSGVHPTCAGKRRSRVVLARLESKVTGLLDMEPTAASSGVALRRVRDRVGRAARTHRCLGDMLRGVRAALPQAG